MKILKNGTGIKLVAETRREAKLLTSTYCVEGKNEYIIVGMKHYKKFKNFNSMVLIDFMDNKRFRKER